MAAGSGSAMEVGMLGNECEGSTIGLALWGRTRTRAQQKNACSWVGLGRARYEKNARGWEKNWHHIFPECTQHIDTREYISSRSDYVDIPFSSPISSGRVLSVVVSRVYWNTWETNVHRVLSYFSECPRKHSRQARVFMIRHSG